MKNTLKTIRRKMMRLKDNPKILLYKIYRITNLFKKNVLNNGERYDNNIMNKFNMKQANQTERYFLAKNLILENESVLDIACGTGYGTLILSEKCSNITGVDISKKAIEYADKNYKKNDRINFIASDIFNFNNQSDFVVSFETVEHVPGEIEKTVLKLLSLSKKRLIFSVPYLEKRGHNKYHVHFDINENTFNFIDKDKYSKETLYQSTDGKIYKHLVDNMMSLIIIVSKK